VAEQAGMPANIIADAKVKAKQLENFDYRKKAKVQEEDQTDEEAEKTAAAMEFLHKFRKLPLDQMSKEEIEATVVPLLTQYGFPPSLVGA
jgi:DNA mismatch repair ATPase MutS